MNPRAFLLPLLLALLVGALAGPAAAQEAPLKWGKVPQEHLEMTSFPADTNASAVILADYGTVTFNNDYSLTYERHRRIKILTEAGFDWGTFALEYYTKDRSEQVRDVKAQTLILGPGGKVQQHALGKKDIFTEKIDERYSRVRFTLPSLQPGAVIEYRYTVEANSPYFMPDWQFQSGEPTLWSEFRPEIPGTLQFAVATRGTARPFSIEETKDAVRPTGQTTVYRWVKKDVPALREEPYMTTTKDYRAALELQLKGYVQSNHGYVQTLHTWDKVAGDLRADLLFGQFLNPPREVRGQVNQVVAGIEAPEDRMKAVYDYVRSTITWNGRIGAMPLQELDDFLKAKQGSSADIALLLASMLRQAGFDANPVLIGTRKHGKPVEMYPLLSQFNDLIVHVQVGSKGYLLDATNPLRPYDLLPFDVLNGRGWMVRGKDAVWVDIASAARYEHNLYVEAALDASGSIRALVQSTDRGYGALEGRSVLSADGDAAFVRDVVLDGLDVEQTGAFVIEGREPTQDPLTAGGEVLLPAYATAVADLMYIHPKLFDRVEKNPFRTAERLFPIDYGHPSTWSYTVRLTLPDGYVADELPKGLRVKTSTDGASFIRTVNQESGAVVIQTRLDVSKPVFHPSEYRELRGLYEQVVASDAEQIVLKRAPSLEITDSAVPADAPSEDDR